MGHQVEQKPHLYFTHHYLARLSTAKEKKNIREIEISVVNYDCDENVIYADVLYLG